MIVVGILEIFWRRSVAPKINTYSFFELVVIVMILFVYCPSSQQDIFDSDIHAFHHSTFRHSISLFLHLVHHPIILRIISVVEKISNAVYDDMSELYVVAPCGALCFGIQLKKPLYLGVHSKIKKSSKPT
jgi:hypothetical protein